MNHSVLYILISLVFVSCSKNHKSDQELLKLDKTELTAQLNTSKVSLYKFGKIIIKASVVEENLSPELEGFQSDIYKVSKKIMAKDSLTFTDGIFIYRDYRKMRSFTDKIDEDLFPSLFEVYNKIRNDSLNKEIKFLEGKDKVHLQNIEHSLLSVLAISSKDLGKEIALYECSKIDIRALQDSEIKTLIQFVKGFLFFEKKLFYLSEDEISENITWLNKNKDIDLPYTRAFFEWGNLDTKQTYYAFHGLNHLFRGFDRLMMERKIDEERALQDFEVFLQDTREIGLENEVVWAIESYLYYKNGNKAKTITALKKLNSSTILSSTDKKNIAKSIDDLENNADKNKLNGVYGKYFLSNIATKYMFSILSQIDYEKVLKDQNVPHTAEVFETLEKMKTLSRNLETYTSPEVLKDKSKNLMDKAKELVK